MTTIRIGRSALAKMGGGLLAIVTTFGAAHPTVPPWGQTPATIALELTTGARIANGSDTHTATATVRNARGEPLSGVAITFALENARQDVLSTRTNDMGVASAPLRTTKAGIVGIVAAVSGSDVRQRSEALFVAGVPSLERSIVECSSDARVADGTDTHWLRMQLLDRFDNPVSGITVHISADPAVRLVGSQTTGDDGVLRSGFTSVQAGAHRIHVTWKGIELWEEVARFRPGVPDGSRSTLTISPDVLRYEEQGFYLVQAKVTDANGNPVAGAHVHFTPSPRFLLTTGQAITDADGSATTTAVAALSHTHDVSAVVDESTIGSVTIQVVDPHDM
ncbi:Ig-like domain-containing protein [Leifsonia sp. NPDC102414]|uniref:Ig-like domain-containing protein n=1 Tax=Leifsonia sp. NPDC102414 TaxID=3364124 RepID=UPI0038211476